MKNKGFTLVELLAVVTIFSIICVLAIPPILNQVNNNKAAVSKANLEIIYRAADIYIDDIKASATYCITLQELVDKDLLSSPIKDMDNGNLLELTRKVKVVTDINKKATYSLLANSAVCVPSDLMDPPTITVTPSVATKEKQRTVAITYYGSGNANYSNQYSIDGNKTWITLSNNSVSMIVYRNTTVTARVLDKTNNTAILSSTVQANNMYDLFIDIGSSSKSYKLGTNYVIINDYSFADKTGTKKCTYNDSGVAKEITNINEFKSIGSYTITCTISNSYGETKTATQDVTISTPLLPID